MRVMSGSGHLSHDVRSFFSRAEYRFWDHMGELGFLFCIRGNTYLAGCGLST